MATRENPTVFTAEASAQLRAAATSSEHLAKELSGSASAMFHMGGR
ncbi:hypothetical protein [Streptomyces sp. WAC07061]|nr:hypothetical protein [Streptomyces sp. WAC07061]